ncbi:unnamed protein product [Trichogramma brassicae]|uniref:Uncharacterized protein n=1 Tax=Trichogramma brassicae TaxID=86971 RepID=A0A6H5IA75_9HYME|nr:unnamed protein product [Trichogramma brassicae]
MKSSIEVSPTADATNSVQLNPSTASTVLPTTALPSLGHIQKRNVSAAEVVLADESRATEPTPKPIAVENEPRSNASAVDDEQEPEFNIDTFVSELLTNADEPSSESHDESVSKNLQDDLERKDSPMTVEEAIENFISVPDMADVVSDEMCSVRAAHVSSCLLSLRAISFHDCPGYHRIRVLCDRPISRAFYPLCDRSFVLIYAGAPIRLPINICNNKKCNKSLISLKKMALSYWKIFSNPKKLTNSSRPEKSSLQIYRPKKTAKSSIPLISDRFVDCLISNSK